LLLIMALAVILALFIGTQVIGVLYAIVFPAQPPRFADSRELRHTSDSYGVDEWLYETDTSACEVLAFYQSEADTCRLAPTDCSTSLRNQNLARCSGETFFSIFAMKWEVSVSTGDSSEGGTLYSLSREIFWTGSIPQPVPTLPDE
jgi:hypothetical protein